MAAHLFTEMSWAIIPSSYTTSMLGISVKRLPIIIVYNKQELTKKGDMLLS